MVGHVFGAIEKKVMAPHLVSSSPFVATVAAYTGPGDIVSGATAWWGLRAYNAAKASALTNAVDIIRASDSATQTFTVLADGTLDIASINTFLASTTGKVTKLWDQTGNGNHLAQSTDARRPAFTLSAIGSLPAMTFTGSSPNRLELADASFNGGASISQPYTMSIVYKDTSPVSFGTLLDDDPGTCGIWATNSGSGGIDVFAGTALNTAAISNTWHAIQGVFNGASGDANVDGTANTGAVGARAFPNAGTQINIGADLAGDNFTGLMTEVGIWPSAFSSGNSSSMSSNQHTYWGF